MLASLANAQAVDQSELAACAALPTDAERLECFQALAGDGATPGDAAPAESAVSEAAPPPAEASVPVEVVAPATAGAAMSDSATVANQSAGESVVAEAPARSEPVTGAAANADDFGREHIESPAEEVYELRAIVTRTERKRDRGITFYLDNGQVWQQVEDRYFPYPKDEAFEIVIEEGMMGDYRLRVGGEGRMTRVKRRQ